MSRSQATPWLERTRRPATAVYIDQPWERYFHLIRLALPKIERLGWVYGPTLRAEVPRVQQAARAAGLSLESLALQPGDNLSQRLDALLPKVDALLAPADPAVVRPDTAYALLLTTYHHHVPVIGYSKAFVDVGALVAVYATLAQQGRQAAMLAAGILRTPGRSLPPPQLADALTVAVNPQVARSLNLVMPEAATLEKALSPSTDPSLK